MLPESIFTRDGEDFVPTPLAHGPWHDDSQHGSAMSGLLAHAIDALPRERPMQVVRLTIDLIRAAPFVPVRVETEIRHEGKSVQRIEARLLAHGEVCARAHAVRMASSELPVPDEFNEPHEMPRLDPEARIPLPPARSTALHDALWLSPVDGFAEPMMWVKMLAPLVADVPLSPLVRVAVAVDWVYACVSLRQWMRDPARIARRPFVAINVDNHAVLTRPVEGEWVGLEASALYGSCGAGASSARLWDTQGPLGTATQTLLQRGPEKRPKAWG